MTATGLGLLLIALGAPAGGGALRARRAELVSDLAALRFERLGNPQLRWDAIPHVFAPRERPHNLLVVLVSFADKGFERFAGAPDQGARLAAWYQQRLFDPTYQRRGTLSHYYLSQSLGAYHLQGRVLPPVQLKGPRAAYGGPIRPEGGDWRNDRDAEGMVEEVLALTGARSGQAWEPALFDRWDPTDFDGDGVRDEADGYLDHFVIIYAGGGQAACHGLYKLDDVMTPNVGMEVLERVEGPARACADRLWPHRFTIQKREGQGPLIEGQVHARGGAPVLGDRLWSLDYNMQSEYTEVSTFIHEFAHSLGLPDVYARTTSNSSGPWEVMSATADPIPQGLSAWSRLMLGWLRPRVFLPPGLGGRPIQSVYLRALDDPPDPPALARALQAQGLWRAALVVLPPRTRELQLGPLPDASGGWALYSGQGNELQRTAALSLRPEQTRGALRLELTFDAWWEIEAGWDFAYLETSTDGHRWQRRIPSDRRQMPAKHGHDGRETLPGFTGLSGDLDGDGKNESNPECDPKAKLAHGEDRAGKAKSPCRLPSWVRVAFDLTDLAGEPARVRLRYFTDMAAVERGILIDNVRLLRDSDEQRPLSAQGFEAEGPWPGWRLDGFTRSTGHHTLLVPHYYLLEFRDPYPARPDPARYDASLSRHAFRFYWDVARERMAALEVRPRPGVVAWYVDGTFAWSENDPVDNGPGRGFLLPLDAWPNELQVPGAEAWYLGRPDRFDTRYETRSEAAQAKLQRAFVQTSCFVRSRPYLPRDLDASLFAGCPPSPPVAALVQPLDGRPFRYSFERINELLPGAAREAVAGAGELYDYKVRGGKVIWRMRHSSLRYLHAFDSPFALKPFPRGVILYELRAGKLVEVGSRPHPAVPRFTDADPARWQNPKLPFGGVRPPREGFGFELAEPKAGAPAGSRVKVRIHWDR